MTVFLASIVSVLTVLLVVVAAIRPPSTIVSLFELRRRKDAKDRHAADELREREVSAQLTAVLPLVVAVLLVAITALLVHLLGLPKGVGLALLIGLFYIRVASLRPVRAMAPRLRKKLLPIAAKYEAVLRLITGRIAYTEGQQHISSREELAHLLETSRIFSSEDRKLLESALRFGDVLTSDIMTPISSVVTVKPNELLGPLVLDDLHKTKHEIFPVEHKGEIVGLLDIRDHVALKRKESVHARDVMHTGVVRISQQEPLDEALRAFVAAKQPYLIVINDDQRPVGMIGLGDIIRALTGWTRR